MYSFFFGKPHGFINPLHPNISMWTFHIVLYTGDKKNLFNNQELP